MAKIDLIDLLARRKPVLTHVWRFHLCARHPGLQYPHDGDMRQREPTPLISPEAEWTAEGEDSVP